MVWIFFWGIFLFDTCLNSLLVCGTKAGIASAISFTVPEQQGHILHSYKPARRRLEFVFRGLPLFIRKMVPPFCFAFCHTSFCRECSSKKSALDVSEKPKQKPNSLGDGATIDSDTTVCLNVLLNRQNTVTTFTFGSLAPLVRTDMWSRELPFKHVL